MSYKVPSKELRLNPTDSENSPALFWEDIGNELTGLEEILNPKKAAPKDDLLLYEHFQVTK